MLLIDRPSRHPAACGRSASAARERPTPWNAIASIQQNTQHVDSKQRLYPRPGRAGCREGVACIQVTGRLGAGGGSPACRRGVDWMQATGHLHVTPRRLGAGEGPPACTPAHTGCRRPITCMQVGGRPHPTDRSPAASARRAASREPLPCPLSRNGTGCPRLENTLGGGRQSPAAGEPNDNQENKQPT